MIGALWILWLLAIWYTLMKACPECFENNVNPKLNVKDTSIVYVFQNSILSNIYRKSLHRIMMMIGKNDLLKGLFFDDAPCNIECLLFHNGCNRTRIYCGIMCRQSGHFATCSSSRTHSCSNALLRPWFNPTPPLPVHWVVKDSPKNHFS